MFYFNFFVPKQFADSRISDDSESFNFSTRYRLKKECRVLHMLFDNHTQHTSRTSSLSKAILLARRFP